MVAQRPLKPFVQVRILAPQPNMTKFTTTVKYIVDQSTKLKNDFTDDKKAPVEFGCIFCQNDEEYQYFSKEIKSDGKIVEDTKSGFTYLLNEPIETVSGPLRLVKIRKPDLNRLERGDADFNTSYPAFKKKYKNNPKFELVTRDDSEMLRLSDQSFDVMACFSKIPKSSNLGIKL